MKFILGVLILATGLLSADEVIKVEPFDYVCEQVAIAMDDPDVCEGMAPPQVIITDVINMNPWQPLNGVYVPGEPYVFVSPTGQNPQRTIEHEITHYVLWTKYKLTDKCEHERIARWVAGQPWEKRQKMQYGCYKPTK